MKKHASLIAVLLLLGTVALAAEISKSLNFQVISKLWVGPSSTLTSENAITKSLSCSRDYNFPASANFCLDSPAITCTGATLGDPCMVGSEVAAGDAFQFTCQVTATDTVKVHFCPMYGDGGTIDPADAGFRVRVISNR